MSQISTKLNKLRSTLGKICLHACHKGGNINKLAQS